jgi:hypothetical protein
VNAPWTPDTVTPSLMDLARSLKGGSLAELPRVDFPLFEVADWQTAAEEALETEDVSELAWMLSRQAAYEEFENWRARNWATQEFANFEVWLVSRARWNKPNDYLAALTSAERRAA